MAFSSYSALSSSEKIVLVQLWPSKRLQGWVVHSGSVYKITSFTTDVIVSITEAGVALTSVAAVGSVIAGTYFHDRANQTLYLRTTSSVNPNTVFIAMTFKQFFSNVGVSAPHDLSTGFEVPYLALVRDTSEFGLSLDNQNQLGVAIEGSGSVTFHNDKTYWTSTFDKYVWENKFCLVYAWSRSLLISDAKLIYKGKVKGKTYDIKSVRFQLKDLINEIRANIPLDDISDLTGELVSEELSEAKQRLVYGRVNGMVPTPIDQIVDGYLLAGTVAINNGSATLTGTTTTFLSKYSPGDNIAIQDVEDEVTVKSVDTDTQITLTENFSEASITGKTHRIVPEVKNLRYANRVYKVAGHALKEPSTTVTLFISSIIIEVASVADLLVGDFFTLNSQTVQIANITGSNRLTLVTALNTVPNVGDTLTVQSIKNVFIDNQRLVDGRDFTIDAVNGKLTLDSLAEFNVAPVKTLTGTVSFTSASRSVTGSGSLFTTELKPFDWIKSNGQATYFEVLSIQSDTALTLRSNSSYTAGSVVGEYKNPKYYAEDESFVSCDVLGKTENGVKTGAFIKTGPGIVEDLLKLAGLTSSINTTDFTTAKSVSKQMVGLVIPENFDDKKTPKFRDVITKVNQSVFGTLKQDESFQLSYEILEPGKAVSLTVNESDILGFKIDSKSDKLIKTVVVEYDNREYDPAALKKTFSQFTVTSDIGQYLVETEEEFRQNTVLIDETQAETLAQRYAFFKELSSSVVIFDTKLQAMESQVNDSVSFSHPLLYERFGSSDKIKVSAIQAIKKTAGSVNVEIEDLGNAFARSSAITENTAESYTSASSTEKSKNGYITDSYGMIDNDASTSGINLIS